MKVMEHATVKDVLEQMVEDTKEALQNMLVGEAYELLMIPSQSLQIQREELPPWLSLKAFHHHVLRHEQPIYQEEFPPYQKYQSPLTLYQALHLVPW